MSIRSRSSSSSGSQIKGGGRAALSEEAEEALISLLLSLQSTASNIYTPSPPPPTTPDHNRKREHKRFVKQLIERHERRQLAKKVNQVDLNADGPDGSKKQSISKQLIVAEGNEDLLEGGCNEKVRIELVEAIFGAPSKPSSKAKKSSSSKKAIDFKEGTRKTIVFVRSTMMGDVMKQAKAKLRMKKKPVRCFVVEKKIEMDLVGDLRGLHDGAVVYVTSQEREETTSRQNEPQDDVDNDVAAQDDDDEVVDPLDSIKQAYMERNQRTRRWQSCMVRNVYADHPAFSNFFDKLPPLSAERAQLPAAACREKVLEAVEKSRVTIICGSTGCGKSTQIPQYLLEGMVAAGRDDMAQILVTQPRRVAAMSLAQRVAFERHFPDPGARDSLVGYNVRLDRSVSDSAKIVYCTVGILLRMLTNPKEETSVREENDDTKTIPLSNYSHICLDEVHERDLNTDFCLTLIHSILSFNKHIRIILMSATAASDVFKTYFDDVDGLTPCIINIPGRTFPVDIRWLEDCQRFASTTLKGWSEDSDNDDKDDKLSDPLLSPRATSKIDNDFICKLIYKIVQQQVENGEASYKDRTMGAILVFLPGKAEIEALARALRSDSYPGNKKMCRILRLHSTIPRGEQQVVFRPVSEGYVKIVLATNIAETSITIPDITHVIDTGRVKESRFNTSTRIKELVTVWTSQASAKQRAGRAGRVSAGVCWRLYPEQFALASMPEFTSPEIVRTPLDELILQVCLLYEHTRERTDASDRSVDGMSPVKFLSKAPEPPSNESLVDACEHLLEVGAVELISQDPVLYRLTPLGYHLSRLPMDAKVGKVLLVGCILECVDPALTVAASLSSTKSCFPSRWSGSKDEDWQAAVAARDQLVESGFGGRNWKGGTVKGDSIAAIAAYNEWRRKKNDKERAIFCKSIALDNVALQEIHQLRNQFRECLLDAGFLSRDTDYNRAKDDALLTSCCLVAGLYPNVATLIRPQKGKTGFKVGRLLTKDGDICRPSSSSFQLKRVGNASETGKDAYAMYHAKLRSMGANIDGGAARMVYLQEVNFVSRFALLLFGGQLEIRNNAIIVDGWLKFKVGEKSMAGAVLIQELRTELDNVLLRHIIGSNSADASGENEDYFNGRSQQVLDVVKKLLSEE